RVRRIAVKKIDDPELLIEVAGAEPDEDLRRDAVDKAAELMLSAVLHADGAGEAAAAMAKLKSGDAARDERLLCDIVCRARLSEARHMAFERLREARSFAEIARRCQDPALRSAAIDKLRDEEALSDLLLAELPKDLPKELAMRVLSRINARDLLSEIAQRGRTKALRTAARERLGITLVSEDAPAKAAGKGGGEGRRPAGSEGASCQARYRRPSREPMSAARDRRQERRSRRLWRCR
ncbi:hypothetical protein, partial [Haliangium sp. UPWRP_2]|uniref:hypothetical protein n=1 Tax=Haliangium sp. UPWRP_2 TaxID=1931276 RepID=UPI0013048A09